MGRTKNRKYYTTRDVAEIMECSTRRVLQMIVDGEIPKHLRKQRSRGGDWLFEKNPFDHWWANR